jgi:hypothetical protein
MQKKNYIDEEDPAQGGKILFRKFEVGKMEDGKM